MWISVKDRLPDDSSCVLITDGKHIGGAHWFKGLLKPPDYKTVHPGEWCNQHYRLTGRWIEKPTHWMEITDLLRLL